MLSMDHIEAPYLADMPLGNGVAVVAGAYKGDTVAFLSEYHKDLMIFAFEPQQWAARQILDREIPRVVVHDYGLGVGNIEYAKLYEHDTDAASLVPLPGSRKAYPVEIKDARGVFGSLGFTKIDLFFMNIEGYEYKLLPYLLDYGLPVDRWMIQFHFVEQFSEQFAECLGRLRNAGYTGFPIAGGWELWSR